MMQSIKRPLAILLSSLAVTAQLWGAVSESQIQSYQDIVRQNAFRLKPIPPPSDPAPVVVEQPVNIIFTGITTSPTGLKKAYFKIADAHNSNQSLFPCIQEGERDGALEVIGIDEQNGTVRIRHAGAPITLTFEKNGNKPQLANFAGMTAVPGGSGMGMQTGVPSPSAALPNRALNLGMPNVLPNAGRPIPSRPVPNSKVTAAQNEQALVQSMVNLELNRELTKDKVAAGDLPPLPPTELSEAPGTN